MCTYTSKVFTAGLFNSETFRIKHTFILEYSAAITMYMN